MNAPSCTHTAGKLTAELRKVVCADDPNKVIRYEAHITANCAACGIPFIFGGLPFKLDQDTTTGPVASNDGLVAKLPIMPLTSRMLTSWTTNETADRTHAQN